MDSGAVVSSPRTAAGCRAGGPVSLIANTRKSGREIWPADAEFQRKSARGWRVSDRRTPAALENGIGDIGTKQSIRLPLAVNLNGRSGLSHGHVKRPSPAAAFCRQGLAEPSLSRQTAA